MKFNFISIFILLSIFSCNKSIKTSNNKYQIKVDRIEVQEEIESGSLLKIKFFGMVGRNGTYQFSHFEEIRKDNEIELILWGNHNPNLPAIEMIVQLRGKTLEIPVENKGEFTISVRQPDDTYLRKSVQVK